MLVETRIHLTLTELRSLDFAIPLLYMTFTHRASDSERVEGKKKIWGMMGKKKQQKMAYYRAGVGYSTNGGKKSVNELSN